MDTLLRTKADDLNASLIDFIKANFKGKKIALHIYEDEPDETEYLLSDAEHKKKLLQTIEEVEKGQKTVTYTMDDIKHLLNDAGE